MTEMKKNIVELEEVDTSDRKRLNKHYFKNYGFSAKVMVVLGFLLVVLLPLFDNMFKQSSSTAFESTLMSAGMLFIAVALMVEGLSLSDHLANISKSVTVIQGNVEDKILATDNGVLTPMIKLDALDDFIPAYNLDEYKATHRGDFGYILANNESQSDGHLDIKCKYFLKSSK